ncbi:MAG TPA: DinB family protein [Pyrinomonadaceae bacterium]|nr:DinB family protein [Pyrinomonadaceae bacterium]
MTTDQNNDASLRAHVIKLLRGGDAHLYFDDLNEGFPVDRCGDKIHGLPYTAWQVLEHLRIAQWDIMEFARNAGYVSPEFPGGYWPKENGNPGLWKATLEKVREDLNQMVAIVSDPATDLFAPIPHGTGQTLLRQALLIVDHNSYHLGSLALMKRLLAG